MDRTCKRDGFQMLKIKGRWECAAEYLDRPERYLACLTFLPGLVFFPVC